VYFQAVDGLKFLVFNLIKEKNYYFHFEFKHSKKLGIWSEFSLMVSKLPEGIVYLFSTEMN